MEKNGTLSHNKETEEENISIPIHLHLTAVQI